MSDEVRETQAGEATENPAKQPEQSSEQQLLTKIKKNRSRNPLQK